MAANEPGTLHTCALRLAGVYGVGELRHIPRTVVSEYGVGELRHIPRRMVSEYGVGELCHILWTVVSELSDWQGCMGWGTPPHTKDSGECVRGGGTTPPTH